MNQLQSTYNKLNGSQITQKNTCNVQKASSARKPTVSTLQVIKFESHKLKSNRSKRKEQYKHGVLWNFQCTQNSEFTRVRKMPNISVFYLSNIDIHHIKLNNWKLMNTKTWEPQTSSKKIVHGKHVLARRQNNVRTASSLSPTCLFKSSGP
jgi:hypothetical protein